MNQGVNPATSVDGDGLDRLSVATDKAADQSDRLASPLAAGDPGHAGDGRASLLDPLRSMHETSNFNSIQPRNRLLVKQASSPTVDTAAMARVVTSVSEAVKTAGASEAELATTTAGSESRDTLATLDSAAAEMKSTWIHAGAQRAEAGFLDPTVGWVGVRANAVGGGVHAELVPGSVDAAQALGSHMAGLNAYLTEHHTPVETLTLTAPESGWPGLSGDQSAGRDMQQGTGQQTGQELTQGANSGSEIGESRSRSTIPAVASGATALPTELDAGTQPVWLGGKHISVMA
jgi:hypothetical protein